MTAFFNICLFRLVFGFVARLPLLIGRRPRDVAARPSGVAGVAARHHGLPSLLHFGLTRSHPLSGFAACALGCLALRAENKAAALPPVSAAGGPPPVLPFTSLLLPPPPSSSSLGRCPPLSGVRNDAELFFLARVAVTEFPAGLCLDLLDNLIEPRGRRRGP